jgi:hypothetical protein
MPTFISMFEEELLAAAVSVLLVEFARGEALALATGKGEEEDGEEAVVVVVDDDDDDETPVLKRAMAPLTSSVSTLKNPPTREFVKTGVAAMPRIVMGSAFSRSTFSTSSSSPNTGGGVFSLLAPEATRIKSRVWAITAVL